MQTSQTRPTRTVFGLSLSTVAFLVILTGAVFGMTVLIINLPSDSRRQTDDQVPTAAPLMLPTTVAKRSTDLGPSFRFHKDEYEYGSPGHYDFWFRNQNEQPAKVQLRTTSCGCSSLQIGVFDVDAWMTYLEREQDLGAVAAVAGMLDPLAGSALLAGPLAELIDPKRENLRWTSLARLDGGESADDTTVLETEVPAAERRTGPRFGIIRFNWNETRKMGPETLTATLLAKLPDQPTPRSLNFAVHYIGVPSIGVHPQRLNFGALKEGEEQTREFFCFSATRGPEELRPKAKLEEPEPCIEISEAEPLTPSEIEELALSIIEEDELPPTLSSAFRYRVTVYANRDGHAMDLGPLRQAIQIRSTLKEGEDEDNYARVTLHGLITSEVRILGGADRQLLDLGRDFASSRDRRGSVRLVSDEPGVTLTLMSEKTTPSMLQVTLEPISEAGQRQEWELTVTVPANRLSGSLPTQSAVYLRVDKAGKSKRVLRVPIRGSAAASRGF